jgi:hypothetical protein
MDGTVTSAGRTQGTRYTRCTRRWYEANGRSLHDGIERWRRSVDHGALMEAGHGWGYICYIFGESWYVAAIQASAQSTV